jgi:hypothetical protein
MEGGGKGILRGFPVSAAGVIFGTVVMARRTGRRDRGMHGIPGAVADNGAGRHAVGDGPSAGGAGGNHGTRAEGERGKATGAPKWGGGVVELRGPPPPPPPPPPRRAPPPQSSSAGMF